MSLEKIKKEIFPDLADLDELSDDEKRDTCAEIAEQLLSYYFGRPDFSSLEVPTTLEGVEYAFDRNSPEYSPSEASTTREDVENASDKNVSEDEKRVLPAEDTALYKVFRVSDDRKQEPEPCILFVLLYGVELYDEYAGWEAWPSILSKVTMRDCYVIVMLEYERLEFWVNKKGEGLVQDARFADWYDKEDGPVCRILRESIDVVHERFMTLRELVLSEDDKAEGAAKKPAGGEA